MFYCCAILVSTGDIMPEENGFKYSREDILRLVEGVVNMHDRPPEEEASRYVHGYDDAMLQVLRWLNACV